MSDSDSSSENTRISSTLELYRRLGVLEHHQHAYNGMMIDSLAMHNSHKKIYVSFKPQAVCLTQMIK